MLRSLTSSCFSILVGLLCQSSLYQTTSAFIQSNVFLRRTTVGAPLGRKDRTTLLDGYGVATNYTWKEDDSEIEVYFRVPKGTRGNHLSFRTQPRSIELKLGDKVLMDGERKMRGKVSMDGSFWDIRDSDKDEREKYGSDHRVVTVTIEKNLRQPKDDFEIFDPFWKGIYPHDKEEVLERKYDELEELNIREYAASLGVDIDNINMSMVDKTLFSSGLNVTGKEMDNLVKKGFVKEVTQQADGSEYVTDDEGDAVPYSRFGDGISRDEIRDYTAKKKRKEIPFIDTSSPWNKAVSVNDTDRIETIWNATKSQSEAKTAPPPSAADVPTDLAAPGGDPIDKLTVARLKDILRKEGLKVSGRKNELQNRLRAHVRSMLKKPKR